MQKLAAKGSIAGILAVATLFLLLLFFVASVLVPAVGAGAALMAGMAGEPCIATPTSQTAPSGEPGTPGTSTPGASVQGSALVAASTPPSVPSSPSPPSTCIDVRGNVIVGWAVAIAQHLHDCPPSGMDVCYDSGMPPPAIQWWVDTCPNCAQWQNGNLQCVMFAAAVYGLSALPLYFGPSGNANAIQFWANYADLPNYIEVPSGWSAPGHAGLPAPGDLMIWWESFAPAEGHMAVVLAVTPPDPQADQPGSVIFADANGPAPILTESISPDLVVNTWSGGDVLGYIRYVGEPPGNARTSG